MNNVPVELRRLYQPGVGVPITKKNVAALNGILKRSASAEEVIRVFQPPYMVKHVLNENESAGRSATRLYDRAVRVVASL